MALDEAEGIISLAEQHLANSLSQSSRFQTWTESADADEALTHIYFTALPFPRNNEKYEADEVANLCPYALIYTEPSSGVSFNRTAIVAGQGFGTIVLQMEEVVSSDEQDDLAIVERRWKNTVGVIMEDIIEKSRDADCLDATGVANAFLDRSDNDERVFLDTNKATLVITWGSTQ